MNRLVLQAQVAELGVMRYTPAGLPALDLGLTHASTVSEDGKPRKVQIELRAVGIGAVTQSLARMAPGTTAVFAGFLASARNGRGLIFHISEVSSELPAA